MRHEQGPSELYMIFLIIIKQRIKPVMIVEAWWLCDDNKVKVTGITDGACECAAVMYRPAFFGWEGGGGERRMVLTCEAAWTCNGITEGWFSAFVQVFWKVQFK